MNYHNQRYHRERYPNARPRFSGPSEYIGAAPPILDLRSTTMDLASYWQVVKHELIGLGYTLATARMYHRVLCALADYFRKRHHQHFKPSRVAAGTVRDFIHSLADKRHSWSWIACNISALRTMFDKFGGLSVTKELVTPKRPSRLPEILSDTEAERLLASAPSLRDQLLLELMYRCGLKVGEACALRWQDINIQDRVLRVESARGAVSRLIPIPAQLSEVLALVHSRCPAEDHLFRGKRLGEHLSPRMAHIVLANALQGSRINKPVTCMTLRHTFAVNSLRAGMNICRLWDILGHFSIETTMLYKHCTPPPVVPPALSAMAKGCPVVPLSPSPPPLPLITAH